MKIRRIKIESFEKKIKQLTKSPLNRQMLVDLEADTEDAKNFYARKRYEVQQLIRVLEQMKLNPWLPNEAKRAREVFQKLQEIIKQREKHGGR